MRRLFVMGTAIGLLLLMAIPAFAAKPDVVVNEDYVDTWPPLRWACVKPTRRTRTVCTIVLDPRSGENRPSARRPQDGRNCHPIKGKGDSPTYPLWGRHLWETGRTCNWFGPRCDHPHRHDSAPKSS